MKANAQDTMKKDVKRKSDMKRKSKQNRKQPLIAVVGAGKEEIERLLAKHDLRLERKEPDIVISYGGDGTALRAERQYPGVPRLAVRNSLTCNVCMHHDLHHALKDIAAGNFTVKEEAKLRAVVKHAKRTTELEALNDLNLHYIPPTALRFKINLDGKKLLATTHRHDERTHLLHDVFIGDGLVISTAHGSTGYFRSITRKAFKSGWGVAFNNCVHPARPLILNSKGRKKANVTITIVRGPAILFADNHKHHVRLHDDDTITVHAAKNVARTILLRS